MAFFDPIVSLEIRKLQNGDTPQHDLLRSFELCKVHDMDIYFMMDMKKLDNMVTSIYTVLYMHVCVQRNGDYQ